MSSETPVYKIVIMVQTHLSLSSVIWAVHSNSVICIYVGLFPSPVVFEDLVPQNKLKQRIWYTVHTHRMTNKIKYDKTCFSNIKITNSAQSQSILSFQFKKSYFITHKRIILSFAASLASVSFKY